MTKYILIINNYSSYINLIFIDYTNRYNIIIILLLLYLTH